MNFDRIIKPEIRATERMKDTFDERFTYLRLDKNERLLPFNRELFHRFLSSITDDDLTGYPELGPVYRKLASRLGVDENQVLLAAGSDLAIKSVYEACVGPRDHVVLHAPSYAMYRVYAKLFGAEMTMVDLKRDWSVDADGMLASVKENTKLVAIENPNGFVGTCPPDRVIERFASELRDRNVLLLIDEAYIYVHEKRSRCIELIRHFDNVVVAQTFSKAHGLAGLRVGYLVASAEMMEYISRVRPMHEITSLSMRATEWILDNPILLSEFQSSIDDSKAYLVENLNRLRVSFRNTSTNFILVGFSDPDMRKKLQDDHRILIRRPFAEEALTGWTRVCVGSLDDSKRFIAAVEAVLGR